MDRLTQHGLGTGREELRDLSRIVSLRKNVSVRKQS